MKRFLSEAAIVAKLMWFRVSCYFLIPFMTTYLSLTETWSGTTWDETHWFLHVRILIASALAGLVALVAYIDSSADKAKEAVAASRLSQQTVQQTETGGS